MRFILLSLSLLALPNLVFAAKALYLKDSQLIDWVKETDEPGVYKIYGKFNGEYDSRIVKKEELSFKATDAVNGVSFGWALVWNKYTKSFDHCYVDNLFANGKAYSFCDLIKNDRLTRQYYELDASQMVGQVDSINSLKKNETARLKIDYAGYKKGDIVRIKALFSNNKALVLNESIGSTLMGGPYYNAISKVISVEDLEDPNHQDDVKESASQEDSEDSEDTNTGTEN